LNLALAMQEVKRKSQYVIQRIIVIIMYRDQLDIGDIGGLFHKMGTLGLIH